MTTVGMVGLGNLGLAIAANLIARGHEVVGYRRSGLDAFVRAGGTPGESAADVAARSEFVITCLNADDALADVYSGPRGIVSAARPGLVAFELSTLSLAAKQRERDALAAAGGVMVDGTISGNPTYIAARNAAIFLGGAREPCERYAPVLRDVTDKVTRMGGFGTGRMAKFVAFYLVCLHTLAAAEAFELATRSGLDRAAVFEAIRGSNATSVMFETRGALMVDRDYAGYDAGKRRDKAARSAADDVPNRGMANRAKNLARLDRLAEGLGGAYPVLAAMEGVYAEAARAGFGEHDIAEVFEYLMSAAEAGEPPDPARLMALLDELG